MHFTNPLRAREEAEEKGRILAKELELQKKREEAERKARRGEIDPTHEFTFQVHRICIFDR